MRIKKIISLIISLFMLVNSFLIYSSATEPKMDVYEYNKLIRKLTDAYVPNDFVSNEEMTEYPLNRLIVKTNSNEPLKNDYGAADKIEGYNCLHILQYETEEETDAAYEKLSQDDIVYVEKDYWITIIDSLKACYCEGGESEKNFCNCTGYVFCTCKDPDATENHFSWNSSAVQVDEAFQLINEYGISCKTVKVAVLDTGVYAAHKEFSKNGEDKNRIKTDCKYTYIKDSLIYPSNMDDYYHGTHVAGIIHDNTMENVEIYSYRMSGKTLSSLSCAELTGAIDAAVAKGVDVINMSLRRSDFFNTNQMKTLEWSINNAVNNNVVLVSGAGNEKNDAIIYIPARYDEVITVSATTRENKPDKSYSSYGECVDISAPGTDIRSTSPRNEKNGEIEESNKMMMRVSGTSMATPLVSAAAAMIKSIDPDITPEEVKQIIKDTAYVPDNWEESCDGKNYGTGIVNFYNIAKVMVGETSVTPTIRINSDQKFEITVPDGSDAEVFYTLNSSFPTLENHLTYTEPLNLRYKNAPSIMAACYKDGRLIGRTAIYGLVTYDEKTVFYKWSDTLSTDKDTSKANWRSYNPNIASVDSDGNIKGVSKGDTLITCSLPTGERIIWKVNVKYSPLQAFFVLFFFGFLWI